MDDSYFGAPADPLIKKASLCLLVLLLLRVKRPWLWTLFVSSNPLLRRVFASVIRAHRKDPATVNRRVNKLANLASCSLLFAASANNYSIPKDYLLVYIFMTYYGELNPPSSSVIVSPTTQWFSKLHAYHEHGWIHKLYQNKHKIVFPAIFAQILSNYLTPTAYQLNHKYLSGGIKKYILNPIWMNLSVTPRSMSVNWFGITKSYVAHASAIFAYCALISARSTLTRIWNSLGYDFELDGTALRKNLYQALRRAVATTNFIYSPHLISLVLVGLTSPLLKTAPLRGLYLYNTKQFVKYYIKVIGFAAALTTIKISTPFLTENPDYLSKSFVDALNMYLFRVVVLSKWRIAKSNHPWFTILRYGTWDRIETFVMCFGVWKLMNLNDYVAANRFGKMAAECQRMEGYPILRGISKVMN